MRAPKRLREPPLQRVPDMMSIYLKLEQQPSQLPAPRGCCWDACSIPTKDRGRDAALSSAIPTLEAQSVRSWEVSGRALHTIRAPFPAGHGSNPLTIETAPAGALDLVVSHSEIYWRADCVYLLRGLKND